jgi:hypothetical protein
MANLLPCAFSAMHPFFKFVISVIMAVLFVFTAANSGHAMGRPLAPSQPELKALNEAKDQAPGEILFSSKRSGEWAIYRIYADGTNLVRLSPSGVRERRAKFIKGGKKVVFESSRQGMIQVWQADPDLSNAELLSPPGVQEWPQGISSDGRWLLICREHTPQGYWLRDLHNKRDIKVDFSALNAKQGKTDVWLAPDGRRLYFAFWPKGGGQLGRSVLLAELKPDGKVVNGRKVSDGCGLGWSPDSEACLTVRTVHGGSDIWEIGWDGSRKRLTTAKNWDYYPMYGPDNNWLVWSAAPMEQHDHGTGNYELYVRPIKGGKPLRLTFHSAPDNDPAWRAERGPVIKRSDDQRLFEAENYAHKPAKIKDHDGASGGKAVFIPLSSGKTAMVFGQYSTLGPGRHTGCFMLKGSNQARGDIELDIVAQGGSKPLVSQVIKATSLKSDKWACLNIGFESQKPLKDLEARVAALPEGGGVWVDYIEIKPEAENLLAYMRRLAYATFIGWWKD